VAHQHAEKNGPGFVILRVDMDKEPADASWSWEKSPDKFDELEVLLRGVRIGVEVFVDG
jgi:hypothetical protein